MSATPWLDLIAWAAVLVAAGFVARRFWRGPLVAAWRRARALPAEPAALHSSGCGSCSGCGTSSGPRSC